MTVIGSASIDIRANDRYFEPDVRRAVAKIKNVKIDLKVNADMSAANKKLRDLRYRMAQNEVSIKIRADDSRFETDVRVAVRKIKNVQIDLKADVDVTKASKKIRDLRYRITSKDAILKVDANLAKAEEKMRKFLEKFINTEVNIHAKAHTGAANTALSELQTRYGGVVNFTANANTTLARAALAHAARTRHAKIIAKIDPDTQKALTGAFNTITGTLPFDKIKKSITGVVANFEGLALKVGLVSSALLGLSAVALTAGANIFSIGGDITQVIGIAAMLPAVFASMISIIVANKMAWKDVGTAINETGEKGAEALAKLPPNAQKAVLALRGVYTEIQKPVQNAFWEQMDNAIGDMLDSILPSLIGGLSKVGGALGGITKSVAEAFGRLGDGTLERMFDNLSEGLGNMTEGSGAFIDALNILGDIGSTYLPELGTSLNNSALKFRDFISEARDAGKITEWIDTSVRRFQELGSVVSSTTKIMSGLTEIARLSGAPGLTQMADGFRNVADVVNSEPFRSQLISILEGARGGTEALGAGLSTLTQLFWDSAESVGAFLELAGEIVGLTFENITSLFDGTGLGSGLYEALLGLKEGMGDLDTGFTDMGVALGDVGRIAGELFRNMAPSLNMLAETIRGVVDGLADGIIDAMPMFNEFAQAVLNLASGPLIALAQGIGNVLTTLSEMPGVVQTVIMSLGLFLLLKPKFDKFFGGMATSLRKEDSAIGKTFREMRTNAVDTGALMRQDIGRVGTSFGKVMTETGNAAKTGAGKVTGAFGSMAQSIRTTMGPLGKEVGNALMAAGGLENVKKGFGDMRVSAVSNFNAMRLAADLNAGTMQGKFDDASKRMGESFSHVQARAKAGFDSAAGHARNASDAASRHMRSMANAVDGQLGRISPSAQKAFNTMGLSAQAGVMVAKTAIGSIPGTVSQAATTASGAFSRVGSTMSGAFKTVDTAIKSVGTQASTMAGRMHASLAPARLAFTNLATHAVTAGQTAARGMGSGLKSAGAGLAGALGGPWGLAIAGATVALGVWAQAQAESKGRVDELTKVIEGQAGALGAAGAKMLTNNLMDGATTKWDDFWRGAVKGSKSVEESFGILGVSVGDVGRKLADSSGRDKYTKGWQDIHDAMRQGKKPTEEMLTAVGMTNEQLERLNTADVGHLNGQLQAVADEAKRAEIRAEQLADATGVAGVNGAALARNYEILATATSSVSEKTAAFKQNLEIVNDGTTTALEASSRYHESLVGTNDQLNAIAVSAGGSAAGLLTQAGAFDVTTAAGNDLFKTVNAHKDGIIDMGISVMQNAINNGESISVAKARAVESMEASKVTLHNSLTAIGIDAEVATKLLGELGLDNDKLVGALVMETDDANFKIAQTALAANAYANGEYAAALSAMPQAAKDAILSVTDYLTAYKEGGWDAVLKAIDATGAVPEEVLSSMLAITDEPFLAAIEAENLTGPAFNEVVMSGDALSLKKFQLDLTAEDKTKADFDAVADRVDTWEEVATVELKALDGSMVPIGEASEHLRNKWFNSDYGQLVLRAIDETQGGVDPALFRVNKFKDFVFGGVDADLTATDSTEPAAGSAMGTIRNFQQEQVDAKNLFTKDMSQEGVNLFNTNVDSQISNNPAIKDLMTEDKADPGIESAKQKIFNGWYNDPHNIIELMTNDQARPGVDSAKNSIETGLGGIGGMGGGGGLARGISLPINVLNMAEEGTASAANTMATGVTDQHRGIFATNNTAGTTAEAQAGMNTLTHVQRNLLAANLVGGPVGAAQGNMNSMTDVQRSLLAQNLVGGPVGAAITQIGSVKGTDVDVIARDKGSDNANRVADAINRVVGRTVDVVTNFVSRHFGSDDHADGGVYLNPSTRVMAQGGIMKSTGKTAVQAFANGGITRGAQQRAVKAFAGGGIENHTAQIARGAWPVRVWAEPETGGEAYIPLSPNKRKRSLDILKIVMEEFGLEHLTHSFADGGINKASQFKTPSVVSARYAAPTSSRGPGMASASAAAPNISLVVNPSEKMDEEQIGASAAKTLHWNFINR